MAATDTTADDEEQAGAAAIMALEERLAEQSEHQENFQTFLRGRSDPDVDATEQFQQDLIEFIKAKMAAKDIGIPVAAIALWEQVATIERNVRDSDDGDGEPSGGSRHDDSPGATHDEGDATLPNDPTFH